MKKNTFKNILIFAFLSLGTLLFWTKLYQSNLISYEPSVVYTHADYVADFSDNKKVSSIVDNMFVWKVVENLWPAEKEEWWTSFPRTLFKVEVLYNIKWKLEWKIITRQFAWYDEMWNLILRMWDEFMEVWSTYLLTTINNKPYAIMSHPNGKHLLTSESNLTKKEIKTLIKDSKIVKDFRKSYKEESLKDDEKIFKNINSYEWLSKDEKNKFEDIENGFVN